MEHAPRRPPLTTLSGGVDDDRGTQSYRQKGDEEIIFLSYCHTQQRWSLKWVGTKGVAMEDHRLRGRKLTLPSLAGGPAR